MNKGPFCFIKYVENYGEFETNEYDIFDRIYLIIIDIRKGNIC